MQKFEVSYEKLYWHCDPTLFKFECTKELAPLREFIGQERAQRAMEFGLNMPTDGYNIYMAGLSGTGKTSMVKTFIEKLIREQEARGEKFNLEDWCYLFNFKEPDRPRIVQFPKGEGRSFRDRIEGLLPKVREAISKAFSADEYKNQTKKMVAIPNRATKTDGPTGE